VTTYTFTGAVAYDRLGSSWRTAAGLRSVSVTDPATGLLPTNLVQGGVAVTWLTADANSRYSFSCDVPGVVVDFGAGAEALYANEVPGLAIVAGAATDTAVSTLVGNPASATRASLGATFAPKAAQRVNVWDYGVVGDGSASDTTAVQAAITAAGVGGSVYLGKGTFGQGRFKCGPLTLLDYQTLEGDLSSIASTAVPKNELYFSGLTGTQVGITMGIGCTLRNLQLRGPGYSSTCVGTDTTSTEATYDQVYWMSWGIGARQTGTYYSRFDRCSWRSCAVGLNLSVCYNVTIQAPRFACMNETTTAWGTAIQADTVRPLTIHGGSIEQYGAGGGIKITAALSQVSIFGVYWESAGTSAVGISATGLSSLMLTVLGNLVYLDGHVNWFDLTGSVAKVVSKGHMFSCATGSATTPLVYKMTTGSTRGELGPDDWTGVLKTSVGFDAQAFGAAPGLTIMRPQGFGAGSSDIVMQGRAIAQAQKTVTTTYTVTGDDYTIIGNHATTAFTITLPDPLSGLTVKGRRFVIKNIGAAVVTVVCSPGTRLIDGATSQTLNQWQSITVECDFATGYLIVAKV
jgi:hypothetical protein